MIPIFGSNQLRTGQASSRDLNERVDISTAANCSGCNGGITSFESLLILVLPPVNATGTGTGIFQSMGFVINQASAPLS